MTRSDIPPTFARRSVRAEAWALGELRRATILAFAAGYGRAAVVEIVAATLDELIAAAKAEDDRT